MRNKRLFICASLTFIFVISHTAWAYWDVIDLGTLNGYTKSVAYSINDNGQVVGWAQDSHGDYSRACLFDSTGNGNNINLGTLPNGQDSKAYSINNNGQIVGHGDPYACIFDPTGGGTNINLGRLPYGYSSCAYSINNNGQIVGRAGTQFFEGWDPKTGKPIHSYGDAACLFDQTGGGVNMHLLKGQAFSINDNGQIVGTVNISPDFPYDEFAYLFNPTSHGYDGINLGIGTAYSINNSGQIVGVSGHYSAFLIDLMGPDFDLGTLGGEYSSACSINDIGQIVGSAQDVSGNYCACLFDPTGSGNNIDLNNLIDPLSGWILTNANDINNNGWIVGSGINPDGNRRAFLLVPEPISAVMFGLGAVIFSLRRKRLYKDRRK